VAGYWTGGGPPLHRVANVSVDGAYIEAPDKWYPGRIITLVFQLGSAPAAGQLVPCTMRAMVVRSAKDGFAVEFLFGNEDDERSGFQQFLRTAIGAAVPSWTPLSASGTAGSS